MRKSHGDEEVGRFPLIHPGQRKDQIVRHNPDHRIAPAIEFQRAADDIRVASKPAPPKSVAQDRHLMAGLVFTFRETSSHDRLDA